MHDSHKIEHRDDGWYGICGTCGIEDGPHPHPFDAGDAMTAHYDAERDDD